MPKITVDIPAKFMPELVDLGTKYLTDLNIDTKALTNQQIVQTYLLNSLRRIVVEQKRAAVEATSNAAIMAAIETARTTVSTTVAQAEVEAEEIV